MKKRNKIFLLFFLSLLIYGVGILGMIIINNIINSFDLGELKFKFNMPIDWWGYSSIFFILVLIFLIYILFLKRSKNSKSNLASAAWLSKQDFYKKFKSFTFKDKNIQHGFLLETKITSKEIIVRPTNEIGHALVVGATRSGKTSRLVNPNIQSLARSEPQCSMIISDPKGELFDFHSKPLKELGYEVLTINLRDETQSSYWNPLEIIWEKWKQKSSSVYEQEKLRDEAKTSLSALAEVMFPIPPKSEAIWTQGANTIFQFMVLAMLELSEYDEQITLDKFNIHNVLVNLNSATYDDLKLLADLLEKLARKTSSFSSALSVGGRNIRGAENTVNGMVQNAVSMLKVYNDTKVKRIVSKTTLKIDDSKPQAIFLIVPDEEKSTNGFISLFVAETYKNLIRIATSNEEEGKKLKRPLYYILDEFGNIPKIPNLDSMVTVSASRNIFFMFILQNYKQINEAYGPNIASVIMGNCGYQYYLLTNDHETAETFSKTLGEKQIKSISTSSSSNQKGNNISTSDRTRRLIHADELMKLEMGEIIVIAQRMQPIKSNLDAFWNYKDFIKGKITFNSPVTNNEIFADKYTYNFVSSTTNNDENQKEVVIDFLNKEETRRIDYSDEDIENDLATILNDN